MSLSFKIALRYFFASKKRSFISIVALIAMIGVGVGAMAMVVVLSVFNGMEELNRQIFRTFDAEVKIAPVEGRKFLYSDSLGATIGKVDGVAFYTQVLEDNALAVYDNQQIIVHLKGVDSTFEQRTQIDTAMIDGSKKLYGSGGTSYALISEGIRNALMISLRDYFIPFELWYPRTDQKTLNFSNADAFQQQSLLPGGTFYIEARYDDFVIIPIEKARALMGGENLCSSIEIQLEADANVNTVTAELQKIVGDQFVVLDRDQQNADLLRAIRVEKLFVTITLSLIILVAAINIFFSLSMLTIEKKSDTMILYAMGASRAEIRNIFITVGTIVALSGALLGLAIGILICWIQETYGVVSMGMETALVEAYPIKLAWEDVLLTGVIIAIITVVVSFSPAYKASKGSYFKENQ